jgi:23S rRNA (cytidine1920-2'-O)/16S rRNA (cytidine1409-2'-O)-methyltransferase
VPAYVSRGGLKLRHALDAFGVDVSGFWCADLGCSTGGFTDCLLRAGAGRVFAVDTAYGELAWTLRKDPRVVVMERTNALHGEPPREVAERGGVDLVVIDLGWTVQARAIPAALRWVRSGGRIITLIKPHYEVEKAELGAGGVLEPPRDEAVARATAAGLETLGVRVLGLVPSPVLGGKKGKGNREWLALGAVDPA